VKDYLPIEPRSTSNLKAHVLTVSSGAFVCFLVIAFISHMLRNDPLVATGITITAYALFVVAVYGFMSLPTMEVLDNKKHKVYAVFALLIYIAAIIICTLAYANFFTQYFSLNGAERLLMPQAVFATVGICFYLFSSTINAP
jgi:hypothetical protein